MNHQKLSNVAIWETADKYLRKIVEPHLYGDFILPFTVLRRIECVLEKTKSQLLEYMDGLVADEVKQGVRDKDASALVPLTEKSLAKLDSFARHGLQLPFYNTSVHSLARMAETNAITYEAMEEYIGAFSADIADVWENFDFMKKVQVLSQEDLLVTMVKHFAKVDLSPERLDEYSMGNLFEGLMYRSFSQKGSAAGAFYTPRDAVQLVVDVLLASDDKELANVNARPIRSVYDPTAGTAGMLIYGAKGIRTMNPHATVDIFGQELMPIGYATGKSDVLIAGGRTDALRKGNTLLHDLYEGHTFDYVLSNPPFGTDWEVEHTSVVEQSNKEGSRFSHGLPKKDDGQMLFLCHVAHKLRPAGKDGAGGRGVVFSNGGPLFNGAAESGPDNIRKWLLEEDLIDAIIQLPNSIFYGTDIATYAWILDTNKEPHRKGFIQLIDASEFWEPMPKGMGKKRRYISDDQKQQIVQAYADFKETPISKILTADDLGYKDVPVSKHARLAVKVDEETTQKVLVIKGMAAVHVQLLEGLDGVSFVELEETVTKRMKERKLTLTPSKKRDLLFAATVEDPEAELTYDSKGKPVLSPDFSMTERVALSENVTEHMEREVLPYAPDVVWDEKKAKIGYEIPFTRIFYKPEAVRDLDAIDVDVQRVMGELAELFAEVKE